MNNPGNDDPGSSDVTSSSEVPTQPWSISLGASPKRWEPPSPTELDSMLPGFTVEALIGRGGMGAVYKATQISLDRPVAIKLLPKALTAADPGFKERFKREARAMAKLVHPNIVTVHDFESTADGHCLIIMEFVDGLNFHQWIHSGDLQLEHVVLAMGQICDALQFAHSAGYIHRDIKPANIFLSREGIIKVGDFGLAKLLPGNMPENGLSSPADPPSLTLPGMGMGTPGYSAPEQMDGHPTDHRADIYSLGVMLYEMLTHDLPRGHFRLPSQRVAIDTGFDQVVLKAMDSEPDRRFSSAAELKAELETLQTQTIPPAIPEEEKPPAGIHPKKFPITGITGAVGGLVIVLAVVFWFSSELYFRKFGNRTTNVDSSSVQPTPAKPVIVYEKVSYIKGTADDAVVPLAKTPNQNTATKSIDVMKRMLNGEKVSPTEAQDQIFGSQEALLNNGTEVKVLEHRTPDKSNGMGALLGGLLPMTKIEVRNGPHAGKQGWVLSKLIEEKRVPRTQ